MDKINRIIIDKPSIIKNKVSYTYSVEGEWKEVFKKEEFSIEYSKDVSQVPLGIMMVPVLANILPIAWVCDAQIEVPICDKAFYDSIDRFKKGYMDMYPMISFQGNLYVEEVQENHAKKQVVKATFFSGGVDAFNTLVCHADEYPTLITLWGADIKLEDIDGWNKVEKHLEKTSKEFDVEYITIKSQFRYFLNEWLLGQRVKESKDGWWHGFQHGIGIISHAAPIAYLDGFEVIYFASSFTIADKGKVTCASDPTIDNYVRFCDAKISHDGYEFDRQMKVHNITMFASKNKKEVPLRVCWESQGGSNCCNCEKCWRTILSLYAEKENPRKFDFQYTKKELRMISNRVKYKDYHYLKKSIYQVIQKKMQRDCNIKELPKEIRWFYSCDINRKLNPSIMERCINKLGRILCRIK